MDNNKSSSSLRWVAIVDNDHYWLERANKKIATIDKIYKQGYLISYIGKQMVVRSLDKAIKKVEKMVASDS